MDFDSLLKAYKDEGSRRLPSSSSSSSSAAVSSSSGSFKRSRAGPPLRKEQRRRNPINAPPIRVLVIVCAGPASLHDTWFEGLSSGVSVDITTCVVWYGKEDPAEKFVKMAANVLKKQGPKWVLVRAALKECFPEWRNEFDYIWLPDDDIKFVIGDIPLMVQTMEGFAIDLAQPCLTDKNITCAAYRPVLLRSDHLNAVFHRTNCKLCRFSRIFWTNQSRLSVVEIMCPALSVNALKHVFQTIDDDRCQCGWGLDSVWSSLLESRNIAVLDNVQIEHVRPPNAFAALTSSSSYISIDPRKEELELLTRYRVAPFVKRVFEIVEEAI